MGLPVYLSDAMCCNVKRFSAGGALRKIEKVEENATDRYK